jgi:peptidase E
MVKLHLFSTPGIDDLRYIVEASRPYLEGKENASVAYLPLASLYAERWLGFMQDAFKDLATVDLINAETMSLPEIQDILRRAAVLYIPGGNTFLLNHRLHITKLMPYLSKLVQTMPVVAHSAGTILCGQNILTAKDLNSVGTTYFDGLKAVPYNFLVHYGEDGSFLQGVHDNWLADYHVFQDNPVVMMCDDAHIRVEGKRTFLECGNAWILREGREKEKLEPGEFK